MTLKASYPRVKFSSLDDFQRDYARNIYKCFQGKTDNNGSVTLTANSDTTVVSEAPGRIGSGTTILLSPTTANAATEFGAGTLFVSSRDVSANTFTITHVNNSQTDRTFDYVLVGN